MKSNLHLKLTKRYPSKVFYCEFYTKELFYGTPPENCIYNNMQTGEYVIVSENNNEGNIFLQNLFSFLFRQLVEFSFLFNFYFLVLINSCAWLLLCRGTISCP